MASFLKQLKTWIHPPIPDDEKIRLSFIQKFIKYRRFPFKFTTHIILVILITLQVLLITKYRETYLYRSGNTLVSYFMPDDTLDLKDSSTGYFTKEHSSTDDILSWFKETVKRYHMYEQESLDFVQKDPVKNKDVNTYFEKKYYEELPYDDTEPLVRKLNDYSRRFDLPLLTVEEGINGEHLKKVILPREVVLRVERYSPLLNFTSLDIDFSKDFSSSALDYYFLTQENPLGPFTNLTQEESRVFLRSMISMSTFFQYSTAIVEQFQAKVFVWEAEHFFDFYENGGSVPMYLRFNVEKDSTNNDAMAMWSNPITYITIGCIIFSCLSIYLITRSCIKSCVLAKSARKSKPNLYGYKHVSFGSLPPPSPRPSFREEYNNQHPIFRTLNSLSAKISNIYEMIISSQRFFNFWSPVTLISNTSTILSSILILLTDMQLIQSTDHKVVLLGLSSVLSWVNIVQYLSSFPHYYILIVSLRKGLPIVFRYLIGVIPILFGYAVSGTILFGAYSRYFRDFIQSLVTLFSNANGDVLRDTFDMIYGQSTLLALASRIYLGSFIVLFTYAVINIFILIMEDAYFSTKFSDDAKAVLPPMLHKNRAKLNRTKRDYQSPSSMDEGEEGISLLNHKSTGISSRQKASLRKDLKPLDISRNRKKKNYDSSSSSPSPSDGYSSANIAPSDVSIQQPSTSKSSDSIQRSVTIITPSKRSNKRKIIQTRLVALKDQLDTLVKKYDIDKTEAQQVIIELESITKMVASSSRSHTKHRRTSSNRN